MVYIDNILIYSKNELKYARSLRQVLKNLKQHKLYANAVKNLTKEVGILRARVERLQHRYRTLENRSRPRTESVVDAKKRGDFQVWPTTTENSLGFFPKVASPLSNLLNKRDKCLSEISQATWNSASLKNYRRRQ